MKTVFFQIIFFTLIPIGIFILIVSIKLVRKSFSGNVILEIPFAIKSSEFEIFKSGNYSIWHKGPVFRKAPVDKFRPVIRKASTKEVITLIPSIFRPNSNNGSTGRMELFRFSAPAGKYELELTEGSSVSMVERGINRIFPLKKVETDAYFIQVRESQPFYFIPIGIFLITLAGLCIIGGLVFGILADQIFPK
jgi:hypothetical protein